MADSRTPLPCIRSVLGVSNEPNPSPNLSAHDRAGKSERRRWQDHVRREYRCRALARVAHGYCWSISIHRETRPLRSGLDKRELDSTVYDLLIEPMPLWTIVTVRDIRPSLDLVPATSSLAGAEVDLVEFADRAIRLRTALAGSADHYDVVVIDSPPSLGFLTVNALCAAQHVIVPIQCEYLALEGLGQLIGTIDLVKKQLNPELDLMGVLMTMYDARTRLSAQVVEEVRRYFPQRTFATVVPRSVRLAEAPSFGQSIAEYDAASRGAVAYRAVVDELSARLALGLTHGSRSTAA